jgi:hypothetical protein
VPGLSGEEVMMSIQEAIESFRCQNSIIEQLLARETNDLLAERWQAELDRNRFVLEILEGRIAVEPLRSPRSAFRPALRKLTRAHGGKSLRRA